MSFGPRKFGVTKAEWQACNDPQPMIDHLRGQVRNERLRLFAVACCRRLPRSFHKRSDWGVGVEVAERYATGRATREELDATLDHLTRDFEEVIESDNGEIYASKQAVLAALQPSNQFDPSAVAEAAAVAAGRFSDDEADRAAERSGQANILRALFGDLFPKSAD
jgi:hypothetical protein